MSNVTQWHGCYSGSWNGILVADAFAHPAKVAPGLAYRIYRYMLDRGYIAPGDSVFDPFGGIGGFGYHAMLLGLHWTGVELEPRFVELGQRNIDKWRRDLAMLNGTLGTARLLQGDSRRLSEVVGGGAAAAVSSPPFSGDKNLMAVNDQGVRSDMVARKGAVESDTQQSPGNLATLRADAAGFTAAVSSPPYADAVNGTGEGPGARHDPIYHNGDNAFKASSDSGYGSTPGNVGNMRDGGFEGVVRYLVTPNNRSIIGIWQPVSTVEQQSPEEASGASLAATNTLAKSSLDDRNPPSTGNTSQPQNATSLCPPVGENHTPTGKAATTNGAATHGESSAAPRSKGTVTNAPDAVQPAVYKSTTNATEKIAAGNGTTASTTSKPYASHVTAKNRRSISLKRELARSVASCSTQQSQGARYAPPLAKKNPLAAPNSDTTKAANENLTPSPDNFWSAARIIVEQTYAVLKPGGHTAWVTKRFVRDKKIVEFSEQWAQLCEAVGFVRVEWVRAMLVDDHGSQLDIFGGATPRRTERKSFFRRLAEKKGSPRIDWEDVIIMRKPNRAAPNGNGARSEP